MARQCICPLITNKFTNKSTSTSTNKESFMKLVIEKIDGVVYAMMETNKHHKKISHNPKTKLSPCVLSHECNLDAMKDNSHIVFDIKKK